MPPKNASHHLSAPTLMGCMFVGVVVGMYYDWRFLVVMAVLGMFLLAALNAKR